MPVLIVLGVATVFALVIALAVVGFKRNQARLRTIQSLCMSKNWQFRAMDPYDLPARWPGSPFDTGYDRRATNVVTGEIKSRPMVAFDYSYKTDSRDSEGRTSTTTHRFAVYALGMPCVLPELQLAPEGVFGRLGTVLGMQDIELESEDFNRKYRVRCPDPKLATDILTPRTMEMLLAVPKMRLRFAGGDLLCFDSGCINAAEILNRTTVMANVLDGVPAFVWKDYGLGDRSMA